MGNRRPTIAAKGIYPFLVMYILQPVFHWLKKIILIFQYMVHVFWNIKCLMCSYIYGIILGYFLFPIVQYTKNVNNIDFNKFVAGGCNEFQNQKRVFMWGEDNKRDMISVLSISKSVSAEWKTILWSSWRNNGWVRFDSGVLWTYWIFWS